MKEWLLGVKRFWGGHTKDPFFILALLLFGWGALGWLSLPKYSNPIDSIPSFPTCVQFETHYQDGPKLFLASGDIEDTAVDGVAVSCNPQEVMGPLQALYLVKAKEPLFDWVYRLTLYYAPHRAHQSANEGEKDIPHVVILVSSNGISIDETNYALPDGCNAQGILKIVSAQYSSYLYLAKNRGLVSPPK